MRLRFRRNQRAATAAGLAAILGVALAVRLHGLTYHSLWFDEAMSTVWASKPADQIWRVGMTLAQDKHPPLYYLLLHVWTALFDPGDAAVRALGVCIGALAVLPALGIGVSFGGWRAGVFGALLVALNPFLVWYSQEARMFMPAATFILVGFYGTLLLWGAAPPRSFVRTAGPGLTDPGPPATRSLLVGAVLTVAGFTAAMYSYLFSALVLPVAGVWLLVVWRLAARKGERGAGVTRGLVASLLALLLIGLLVAPLALAAWSVSGQESLPGRAFEGLAQALVRLFQVYSLGWPTWSAGAAYAALIGAALLALIGLVVSLRQEPERSQSSAFKRASLSASNDAIATDPKFPVRALLVGHWGGLLLALWLALPTALGGLLLARDRTVFAETRYFIFLAPAFCLAWGRAVAWLWARWRPAGLLSLALVLGVTVAALPADWSPQNRREAWREAAMLIESQAGSNDAVLVQPDYVYPALTRYMPSERAIYYPFTDRIEDPDEVDRVLAGLRDYDAIWLVQSHYEELDPGGLVAGWFGARYPLATEAFPAGIALHAFVQHYRGPDLPPGVSPVNTDFGELRLLGCLVQPRSLSARDDLFHPPSGWVHVTSYWSAKTALVEDTYPQIRLEDHAGQVWGQYLDRSGDAIHMWPTSRWQPGEVVRLDYDVNLNPVTPPGSYRLVVDTPAGTDETACGDVTVTQ